MGLHGAFPHVDGHIAWHRGSVDLWQPHPLVDTAPHRRLDRTGRHGNLVAGGNHTHLGSGAARVPHTVASHLARGLAYFSADLPDYGPGQHDVDDLRPD